MPENSSDIMVADFSLAHAVEAAKIERSLFRDPWDGSAFVEVAKGVPYRAWVALHQGVVVGYLISQWILDEIHLLNVAVIEELRRKRVAIILMERLFDVANEHRMKHMFLEVRLSNLPAQTLYYRFGFSRLSIRKQYYRDGEDAVVMYRRLEPVEEPGRQVQ